VMPPSESQISKRKVKKIVGRAERVVFPDIDVMAKVPARIDTGAATSALWASNMRELSDGGLEFTLFGPSSKHFTNQRIVVNHFERRVVASSIGEAQTRYVIKLLVKLKGKKVNAQFSLADRSKQVYPVLIGRNVLRGRFLVDVKTGKPLTEAERRRHEELQSTLENGGRL